MLIPVDRYLTEAWNIFTKGRQIQGTITMLADADLFEAFADSIVAMHKTVPAVDERPESVFLYFKTARMYKLANRGWKVRFLASVAQDFDYGG
jgi:ABC-type hemin transport system ATPase subunit